MRVVPKPDKSTPLLAADGVHVNDAWYDFFSYLSSLNLPAVSRTAPTNGQVLIYDLATQLYVPGAN